MQDTLLDENGKREPGVILMIMKIGWPIVFQWLASITRSVVTYWLLGKYADETAMAAYGLANVLCNITGRTILMGLGAGMDTFATQAWGAREHRKLGIVCLRTFTILTLFANVPVCIFWTFAGPILTAAGQPPHVATEVGLYARISLPGQLTLALTTVLTKMLVAMGKTGKMLLINVTFNILGVAFTFLAVAPPINAGVYGAAIVSSTSQVAMGVLYLAVVSCDRDCRKCWPGLSFTEAFRGWWPFLKIAFPAFLMGVCEWWSWDLVTFLAGECHTATGAKPDKPTDVSAAQGLLASILAVSYALAIAVNGGGGTVVGNALGAGDAKRARNGAFAGFWMSVVSMLLGCGMLILLRDKWHFVFRAEEGITDIIKQMIYWVAIFAMADGMQTALAGAISGAGKQAVTTPILVVAYWILGLPLGSISAFVYPKNGLLGVWWGMTLAVYIHLSAFIFLVFCPSCPGAIRWEVAAAAAAERIEQLGNEGEGSQDASGAESSVEPIIAASINAEPVIEPRSDQPTAQLQ